ncbi:hypothetical protein KR018_011922 [Drosophila ironensis]|nr:hypothetical protein KR018_011922 [Drosophila ironensis]
MDDHSKDDLPSGSKELKKANTLGPGDSSDESCGPDDQTDLDDHSNDDLPSESGTMKLNGRNSLDKSRQRFKLFKWEAFAQWAYLAIPENCAICRNRINLLCIECQANQIPGKTMECPQSYGECQHGYHFHCISRWLQTRYVCPLDNKAWEYKRTR